jgi:hypothetical protein
MELLTKREKYQIGSSKSKCRHGTLENNVMWILVNLQSFAKDLIDRCRTPDPNGRASFDEIHENMRLEDRKIIDRLES